MTGLERQLNDVALVPSTAKETWEILSTLSSERSEERIAFAIAGALFLAGHKAGFYAERAAGIDRYVLFFKFVESVDLRLRFDKTFLNLCGRFANYCNGKLVREDGVSPNESAREPVRAILDGLRAVASASGEQRDLVMRALLRVRDASHLFVTFSFDWSRRLSDIDQILEAKFGQKPLSACSVLASPQ